MQYLFITLDYNTLNKNDKSKLYQTNSAYISAFFFFYTGGASGVANL